jgi:hypothetical protein
MDSHNTNLAAFLPAPGADLATREREIPVPGPLEILVRNHAVGLNPIDWKRQTWGFMIPSYPAILGTGEYSPLQNLPQKSADTTKI